MKIVPEKKLNFQTYFGDSKFGMEVDLIETIQKSYIRHVRTLKTELGKAPKASARGSPRRSDARSYLEFSRLRNELNWKIEMISVNPFIHKLWYISRRKQKIKLSKLDRKQKFLTSTETIYKLQSGRCENFKQR